MSGYYRTLLSLTTPSSGGATFSYSVELQAIINRANTEGFYVPPNTILEKVDDLIISLVTAGRFNGQYLFNFAYNDLLCIDFARINWLNPTGNMATLNSSPTYSVYGFKGNGSSSYIDVGYIPGNDGSVYRRNKTNYFIYSAATSTNKHIDGNTSGNSVLFNANVNTHKNYNMSSATSYDATGVGYMNYTLNTYLPPKSPIQVVLVYHKNGTTSNPASYVASGTLTTPSSNQLLFRNNSVYSDVGISYYQHTNGVQSYGVITRAEYNTYLNAIGLASI